MLRFPPYDAATVQSAREAVADWFAENARAIRVSDAYAAHVTEARKDQILAESLANSESIRRGEKDHNLTVQQRILLHLTGECHPLLP
jgi:hypothetical protein